MTAEAFEIAYKRLNKAQKEAVDAIEGPVMVIAGPGTGKTTILTLRIANILKRTDTPAHGILAITYTDAGVRAMREKLRGIIGDRAHDVRIHTFHSFAAAVIAEHPDHFLHLEGLKPMTDIEQETLIRSIIEDPKFSDIRPAGKPDAYVFGIIRSIDDAKREALTADMVKKYAEDEIKRIENDESSISTRGATKGQLKADAKDQIEKCKRTMLFADVYDLYEKEKRENKQMDFNDLIIELLVALRQDELLLRLIQEKFLYIHVDEHQDTNDAQNFIVALIAEFFETPNLFIVGDEKQAIYRFQGASVENFLLLRKRWPAMKLISLDMNYRSEQDILDASWGMIERNYEGDDNKDLRIKLKSGRADAKSAGAVQLVTAENSLAADSFLINELRAISEKEPEATVALITRRNRDLDRVIRLLEDAGIPISSERSVDIFNHPAGTLFFDLLEYLADPTRTDALAKTAIAGMWGLSFEKGLDVVRALKSGRSFEKEMPGLLHIQRQMLNDGPIGFLIHAAEESGYTTLISKDPSYINVWRGIVALAESLVREGTIRVPAELIASMLAYRISAESKSVKISVGAPEAKIRAMTAHGSKGLEFDYVFIPYANDESWIGKPRGSSFVLPKKQAASHDIVDLRRLFYVALTRARTRVTILSPLEESDGRMLSQLRFIEELATENIEQVTLPRKELEFTSTPATLNPIPSKIVHVAKHVLLEKGISVTALNNFIECPNNFLYKSILKLPQEPAVPAEKGNAMHEAISRVWRLENKSVTEIETTLIEGIAEFLERSLLASAEKEAVKKELVENAPEVAKALEVHFASGAKAAIFTEHKVQSHFNGSFGGQDIQIPIHGNMDAIVDTAQEVFIYDYKTRQAMSENAIKGETKSVQGAKGGYFRQLVFYKLLLSEDPRWRTKKITPSLVFVSPDEKGRCPTMTLPINEADTAKVRSEIQTVIDAVWSGKIADMRCTDPKCEWCGLKEVSA